jgi:Protein of unknown function (DUF3379)
MNCLDYQHSLETEPHRVTAEMQAHAQSCPACAAWTQEMHAFDVRLKRALEISVPPAGAQQLPRTATIAPRRFALAASVLGAIALATLSWLWSPRDTLAAEVIEHVEHEPQSWIGTDSIPQATLDGVLKRSAVNAHFAPGSVTYARNCWFRGHLVPHLVVRDVHGAVTVLILAAEQVSAKSKFVEGNYQGVILPAAKGSIAVLSHDDMRVEEVADEMLVALRP